ncbi:MAG: hypothetical protein ACXWRA_11340 [Pseudobdellovibrionaceae bacterium]
MQDKVIDIIVSDLKDFKNDVKADFKEVNLKIDKLLKFKWQIVGGATVASVVVTGLIQFISFLFHNTN